MISTLFIIASILAFSGCNEAYIPPGTDPETTELTSSVTFVITPREGYWTFSDRPDLRYVAAVTRDVTGTITATAWPNNPSITRIGDWAGSAPGDAPPGPIVGDTITITANGSIQKVFALLAPVGDG